MDRLLRAFNELRDELTSTLWFLLGNPDDAQDAVQDVFLKCWRAQATVVEVRDLRAWIFRVGLNVVRDFQRSAWHRFTDQARTPSGPPARRSRRPRGSRVRLGTSSSADPSTWWERSCPSGTSAQKSDAQVEGPQDHR